MFNIKPKWHVPGVLHWIESMELASIISIYSLASVELFDPLQAPLSLFFHVSSL